MARSWEKYIAAEEAAYTSECYAHAKTFNIEDPIKYMDDNKINSCDDMPCSEDCPFTRKEIPNGNV